MSKSKEKKNSKDEWRRKKKLREQATKAASGTETILTADEVKARFFEVRKSLSADALVEFDRLMDQQMEALEAGEMPGPPFTLNFNEMAADAKRLALSRKFDRIAQGPNQYTPQKRSLPEEQSVDTYLQFLSFALRKSREVSDSEARATALQTYVAMENARVIHIGPETYLAVHQEADRYTTTMGGLDYQPYQGPEGRSVSEKENRAYVTTFMRESRQQPYPDKLPFPAVFLGYGPGVRMPEHTMDLKTPSSLRNPEDPRDAIVELYLLGHMMTEDGLALTCYRGVTGANSTGIWFDEARSSETGWTRTPGLDLEPWTLPHLIRIINDHRTFVIETEITGQLRRDVKQNRKTLSRDDYKYMPKPYYTLRLQTHVIQDRVRKQLGRPPLPRRYKTDVRGHERCRVRRGVLPIDPKLADKLQQRGYKLFTTNQLDTDTFQRLHERGFAYKRSDEWLAVKACWVKDHMSSADPKLPYIPAVRKLGNVRVKPRKVSSGFEDPAAQ